MEFEKTLSARVENLYFIFNGGTLLIFVFLMYQTHENLEIHQKFLSFLAYIFITSGERFRIAYERKLEYKEDLQNNTKEFMIQKWGVLKDFDISYKEAFRKFSRDKLEFGNDKPSSIGDYELKDYREPKEFFDEHKVFRVDLNVFGTIGDPIKDVEDYIYFLKFKKGFDFNTIDYHNNKLILSK